MDRNQKQKTSNRTNQRRKTTSKVKKVLPQKKIKSPGDTIIPSDTFHESFPFTLEYMDGKDFRRCFFMCKEHLDTYLKRYKLKKGSYKVFDTIPKNEEKK